MFKKIIEFRFSINLLRWIIYSALLMIVAYVLVPKWHDPLVFIAAVLAGVGVLISAMNEIDSRREQIQAERAHRALQYIHDWNHPTFYHAKSKGREVLQHFEKLGHGEHDYVTERIQNLMDILNFFESMSLAIQLGHVDGEIAKRFFRGIALEYWQTAKPWIDTRRAGKHNPRLLIEFENLSKLWT
jgi:hypothetical protein